MIYSPIQGREDAANVMKMEMLFVIVLMLGQWDMSLNHFGRTHVKYKVFERMQKRLFMSSFQAKFSVWGRPSTPEQSWIRTNNTKSNMKITDNIHHWKIYLIFSGSHPDFYHALYGWFKQRWSLRTLLLLRGLLELGLRSPWLCSSRSWCLVLLRCQGTLNIAQLNIEHKQMLI